MNTQVPAVLQSDNGVEFCADIMEALCSKYGVQHITSSIGRPQSQGATERCNREIKDHIRALLMQAPTIRWARVARLGELQAAWRVYLYGMAWQAGCSRQPGAAALVGDCSVCPSDLPHCC